MSQSKKQMMKKKISRKLKMRIGILFLLLSITKLYSGERISFNNDWEFVKGMDTVISNEHFLHKSTLLNMKWEQISIPHTPYIEPLVITDQQWQGTCFYRKFFTIPETFKSKHVALKFEGAMHTAEVFLNQKKIMTHYGGYLPFYIDLTGLVKTGQENCIVVRLNNEDNSTVPPGKPIANLDFNYYGGIYRDVNLIVKEKVHIADPIGADRKAAGGIMVTYSDVSEESASVNINVDIDNKDISDQKASCIIELRDNTGKIAGTSENKSIEIKSNSNYIFKNTIRISNPVLWSPDNPYLYELSVKIKNKNNIWDEERLQIGIRTFYFSSEDGFVLNGKKVKIRGTNRHQDYPYVGYALSENANYRDAYKIKQAGFNFVRLSHYPHSVSFLKACDELGLMVMDAIPGWQFYADSQFHENSLNDVRGMVRRDRNHPCIILWESSLNESGMSDEYMEKAHNIVHNELPGKDVFTCGWKDAWYDLFIPARQHAKPPHYWNTYSKDKAILIAEYGDWEYYAQNAGFNQEAYEDLTEEERNSRQLRGYGQKRLAQQALNYQEAYNSNLQGPAVGDANWLMFDYNRGYAPDIEASGISDIFRIPKFAFYFYQSQAGPDLDPNARFGKPMIFISNYWNDSSFTEVKIFSNCEEVELKLNNQSLGRQKPDNDRISSHLPHPPFTFRPDEYIPGKLEAIGYINNKEVTLYTVETHNAPYKLELNIDESTRPLESGKNDIVFVYARLLDEKGNFVPENGIKVQFVVEGDAQLIGTSEIETEAGIASVLLRAGQKSGLLSITANSQNLQGDLYKVEVK